MTQQKKNNATPNIISVRSADQLLDAQRETEKLNLLINKSAEEVFEILNIDVNIALYPYSRDCTLHTTGCPIDRVASDTLRERTHSTSFQYPPSLLSYVGVFQCVMKYSVIDYKVEGFVSVRHTGCILDAEVAEVLDAIGGRKPPGHLNPHT